MPECIEEQTESNSTKNEEGHTLSNKDTHKLGKYAGCGNALKNRLSPITQRMKKVAKGKTKQ